MRSGTPRNYTWQSIPKTPRQVIRWRNIMLGLPIKQLSIAIIPYGYEIDPDKEGWLRPVDKELKALYWARRFLNRSSRKQLAAWVTKETGRAITEHGLISILRNRPPTNAYLLPLHERISIATAETEEAAITLQPQGDEWDRDNTHRIAYYRARAEAVRLREQARGTQGKENTIPTEPRPTDGVSSSK